MRVSGVTGALAKGNASSANDDVDLRIVAHTGTGWLSYRLAQLGYRVWAVGVRPDPIWGLGAAERRYLPQKRFCVGFGSLDRPPLQTSQLALNVFNARLHYTSDLGGTIWQGGNAYSIEASPAIADLDGDGRLRSAVGSWDGSMYLWDDGGQPGTPRPTRISSSWRQHPAAHMLAGSRM